MNVRIVCWMAMAFAAGHSLAGGNLLHDDFRSDGCGGFAGQFRPFLYKIAKNVCADWHRASARDGPALESLPEEPGYQEAGFDQTEDALSLRALTARLDPETRELVLLRFGQQLKLREIAQVTGLPLRTVQSRLRAALKILKNQLEQEELP